ncbi:MAG: hypothetical protein HQ509_06210 [Candidatus Marinimicrobia bacterium]|nr:hypothetical protein [Candidatus Neomarinimicrobiota bacterium]
MEIKHINMYERLRDFHVPIPILDELFSSEDMTKTLSESWKELKNDGMREDGIAENIAQLIFKELKIDPVNYEDEK